MSLPSHRKASETRTAAVYDQNLIEYVQTALGITLTSDTSVQALFFNQGDGENGKDTAFGVIAHVRAPTGRA